jgi:sulfatase maturation enzyme AslB (radical SAM superfamily)
MLKQYNFYQERYRESMRESDKVLIELKRYLHTRISPQESYEDLLSFPRYFELETVNACNARCTMCTIDDWTRHSPVMKDPLFKKLADEICAHASEVKRVSLYRDGEPLLDKKMAKRVAMLKDGGVKKVGNFDQRRPVVREGVARPAGGRS